MRLTEFATVKCKMGQLSADDKLFRKMCET